MASKIVDAHHHVWQFDGTAYPWLMRPGLESLRRDFDTGELRSLLYAAGVERTVIVQAADTAVDTEQMLAVARANDFIAGIVGWIPLLDPRRAEDALAQCHAEPKIKGFRHLILFEPDPDWIVRESVIESLALVAERGYTFDISASAPHHLEHVLTLAERLPRLVMILDHLAKPPVAARGWEPWASLMARTAQAPNVHAKLSGLNNLTDLSRWSAKEYQPYVEHALAVFGPERLIFGSNWPVLTLSDDYASTWRSTNELVAGLPAPARAAIFGETATRVYKLDEGPA